MAPTTPIWGISYPNPGQQMKIASQDLVLLTATIEAAMSKVNAQVSAYADASIAASVAALSQNTYDVAAQAKTIAQGSDTKADYALTIAKATIAPTDDQVAAVMAVPGTAARNATDLVYAKDRPELIDVRKSSSIDLGGTASATAPLQSLLTAAPPGSTIRIPPGATLNLSAGPVTPNGAVTIDGRGATIIDNGTNASFKLGPSNAGSRFIGLKMQGNKGGLAYGNPAHRAFDCAGTPGKTTVDGVDFTDTSQWIKGLRFEDIAVDGYQNGAFWMQHCIDLAYRNCTVTNCGYVGFEHLSCWNVAIDIPIVKGLFGTNANKYWQSYPIAASRDQTKADLALYPRSRWFDIRGGSISSTGWEGIDTHGGQDISILGTRIYGTYHGIAAVPCPDTKGNDTMAPLNINVLFCHIESGVSDGSKGAGIKLIGAGSAGNRVEAATGRIIGNTIIGYGSGKDNTGGNGDPSTVGGAIQLYQTDQVLVDDYRLIEPSPFGIALWYDNTSARIGQGVVQDPWHETFATPAAVAIRSTGNDVQIGAIKHVAGTRTATYKNAAGLYVSTNTNNTVRWTGGEDFGAATVRQSGGTTITKLGFGGATPVAIPTLASGATTSDIISALKALGLAK